MSINMSREILKRGRIRAMQVARENNPSTQIASTSSAARWDERRRRDAREALEGGLLPPEAQAMCRRYAAGGGVQVDG